jgi:argininosuccinate lyase
VKLWDRGAGLDPLVERFTAGEDPVLDRRLIPFDCQASMAHARMLAKIGALEPAEADALVAGLEEIVALDAEGRFSIGPQDEDCHTAIENHLTAMLGEVGKKIHLGRSRNDQVLTALRLYEKAALAELDGLLERFGEALSQARAKQGSVPMPGYSHMRPAMPSSVDLWLGCYASAAADDRTLLQAVVGLIDQNPLGTAAGFGVPVFELDRSMTTRELGFARVQENPLYAQHSRGKFEASVLHLASQVMLDLNRLASDLVLYSMREFGFVTLPVDLCTGSSIMPQKKNPDALELVRAHYHRVLADELSVRSLTANLTAGYNRDVQLGKGPLMRSLDATCDCLQVMSLVITGMQVDTERCRAAMGPELYATEEAYQLVQQGMAFRDAYRKIAERYASE